MKKTFNRTVYYIASAYLLFIIAACHKTIPDEITDVNFTRLLSPTELSAIVVNKTSVQLEWQKVAKATSYSIELFTNASMDFSGTPAITINDVQANQLPYTVDHLLGETGYSVRVKAVGDDIDDSKWVSATFTTSAEQIFYNVDPADLQATQVTLRWPAGETATQIVLQPGNITHAVTAPEIAAGAVTITGLNSETTYTAKLLNGTSTRGTIIFTTLIDLGGAIQVNPGDDLTSILQAANDGDVFALMPGTYPTQDITVSKSISIKGARPSDRPVLSGTILRLKGGAGLQLKDIILNGTGSADGNQAIIYDEDFTAAYGGLDIENCEISNYSKGLIYVNKKAWITSVSFKNNIIHNIECNGGDFIDFRNGVATTFNFTNNTVYNSALARDLFRMDAGGSTNFPSVRSIITINNNTFYNVSSGSSNRVLYIRLASHEITFDKNILAATNGYYTNQSATTIKEMSKNNYFNAPNFTGSTVSGAKNDTGDFTQLDPQFSDVSSGNFKVGNITLIANGIGDPRWLN